MANRIDQWRHREQLLALLSTPHSVLEIADSLQVSRVTAHRLLEALRKTGVVLEELEQSRPRVRPVRRYRVLKIEHNQMALLETTQARANQWQHRDRVLTLLTTPKTAAELVQAMGVSRATLYRLLEALTTSGVCIDIIEQRRVGRGHPMRRAYYLARGSRKRVSKSEISGSGGTKPSSKRVSKSETKTRGRRSAEWWDHRQATSSRATGRSSLFLRGRGSELSEFVQQLERAAWLSAPRGWRVLRYESGRTHLDCYKIRSTQVEGFASRVEAQAAFRAAARRDEQPCLVNPEGLVLKLKSPADAFDPRRTLSPTRTRTR